MKTKTTAQVTMKTNWTLALAVIGLATATAVTSGCGMQTRDFASLNNPQQPQQPWYPPYTPPNNDDDDDGGSTTPLSPPEAFSFTKSGWEGSAPSYTTATDSILKVKVHGGDGYITLQGGSSSGGGSGSNGTAVQYGCAQYQITVNGLTRSTKVLASNNKYGCTWGWNWMYGGYYCVNDPGYIACPNAPSSEVIDFSDWIAQSGAFNVTIKVKQVSYNRLGSQLSPIYSTHSLQGYIEVQTNSTTGF